MVGLGCSNCEGGSVLLLLLEAEVGADVVFKVWRLLRLGLDDTWWWWCRCAGARKGREAVRDVAVGEGASGGRRAEEVLCVSKGRAGTRRGYPNNTHGRSAPYPNACHQTHLQMAPQPNIRRIPLEVGDNDSVDGLEVWCQRRPLKSGA